MHRGGQIMQKWFRGSIDNRMDGVDAQCIDVKLIDPHQCIVNKEPSHVIALRAVEIDRLAPRRLVAVGEVRTEIAQIVSFRAEMVVDDVENDGEASLMRAVDETLEGERAAIRILRRPDV